MSRFVAKPVLVTAYRILYVGELSPDGARFLHTDWGGKIATPGMLARMTPVPGDYWVIQEDGYEYLNPKDVFERKYAPAPEEKTPGVVVNEAS